MIVLCAKCKQIYARLSPETQFLLNFALWCVLAIVFVVFMKYMHP